MKHRSKGRMLLPPAVYADVKQVVAFDPSAERQPRAVLTAMLHEQAAEQVLSCDAQTFSKQVHGVPLMSLPDSVATSGPQALEPLLDPPVPLLDPPVPLLDPPPLIVPPLDPVPLLDSPAEPELDPLWSPLS
jgi:hypothetical protein